MPRAAEPRRAVPMRLQRDCALALCADLMRKLGMVPVDVEPQWELDHDPALCLRPIDPETHQHVPHQHEPSCLIWRTKQAHAEKTFGRGGERRITTLDSDAHSRAHVDRLSEKEREFRRSILARHAGEPKPERRLTKRGNRPCVSRNTFKDKRPASPERSR